MPYLIDGHNLIARLPDISLDDPNDEALLVIKLRGFCTKHKKRCTVVFDGGIPGGYSDMSTYAVTVIFASAFHTNADNIIKKRIEKFRDASNWTIISSDNEVLDFARQHKTNTLRSDDFVQKMRIQPRKQDSRGEEINVNVPAAEVDEWLDIFGE